MQVSSGSQWVRLCWREVINYIIIERKIFPRECPVSVWSAYWIWMEAAALSLSFRTVLFRTSGIYLHLPRRYSYSTRHLCTIDRALFHSFSFIPTTTSEIVRLNVTNGRIMIISPFGLHNKINDQWSVMIEFGNDRFIVICVEKSQEMVINSRPAVVRDALIWEFE